MTPESTSEPGEMDRLINFIKMKGLRILIVDDNEGYRKSMGFVLERKFGATVTCLAEGEEAVNRVRHGDRFDLIFLDIRMSPMNGIETYLAVKELAPSSNLVLMSAYTGSMEWKRAEEVCLEVVAKPIRDGWILRLLCRICNLP